MKTKLMLMMYDKLLSGGRINRAEICQEFEISQRTFYRYERELSEYLRINRPGCVIDVLEPSGDYYLKTPDEK